MKSRPELLSGTCCRGHHTDGFLDPGIEPPTEAINLGSGLEPGTVNWKVRTESDQWDRTRMAESGTDLDPGIGTGTGPWPWQELDLDRNWTGESDRWDRTRRGSGNWNLCFWVGSMGSDSTWIQELDRNLTLTGTGQETWPWLELAPWLELDLLWIFTGTGSSLDLHRNWIFSGSSPELDLLWIFTGTGSSLDLHWNRNSKGRMKKDGGNQWKVVSKSSETRERSWILLGDRPPVYPSVLRMGTFSRRVKHRSFTWAPDWSRWPPAPEKSGVKMWEPESGRPKVRLRDELEGSDPCRVQKQWILEGERKGSDPCRVQE